MRVKKETIFIFLFIGAVVMTAILFFIYPKHFISVAYKKDPNIVKFLKSGIEVKVEKAAAPYQWSKGLMFRESLDKNSGMLFIFPDQQFRSFWMKNTLISLDLIFISENKQVVDIKENFQPCKTMICENYSSKKPAKYVLEVNAGFVKDKNIIIGDFLEIDESSQN